MFVSNLLVVTLFLLQNGPSPKGSSAKEETQTQTLVEYRDLALGITFKMDNGRVELTVPNESAKAGESRTSTYKAGSMDEFKRQYPEISKKYQMDRLLPKVLSPLAGDEWWNDWSARFKKDREDLYRRYLREMPKDTANPWANLSRWFLRERQLLQDVERRLHSEGLPSVLEPKKDHAAPFGILIAPAEEPLRQQLGLKPHEGYLVCDVEKGTPAEVAGVRKFDVLLKLNSRDILDTGSFREDILSAMRTQVFTLELLRDGHPMSLSVHPAHS